MDNTLEYAPVHHPAAGPNRGLHAAALLTLCLTFPMIFLGGLVTSHGAGMSVPDWPNSYGYNMFLFPVSKWTGGIFYEHTHRLLGTVVGFCAIVLAGVAWGPGRSALGRQITLWSAGGLELAIVACTAAMVMVPGFFHIPANRRAVGDILPHGLVPAICVALVAGVLLVCRQREPRRWVRWVATACLAAVCVQGVLGGLRVDLISLPLAMVHGCFAQLTFCLMIVAFVVTGRRWFALRPDRGNAGWVAGFAYATVAVVLTQLVVAAVMRHSGAGLAIPGVLAYGHLLPPITEDQLAVANHYRTFTLHMDPVTLGQVWLHFAHRVGAVIVSTAIITLIVTIARSGTRALFGPAAALGLLLVTQVTLGVLTVYYRKPADLASAHVACGALVLVTSVLIAARATKLYAMRTPAPDRSAAPIELPAGVLVGA